MRNAPMPSWAIALAPIPETSRSDPVVLRLSEYQVQLGAETGMLVNRATQVNERNALSKIGQTSIVYYPVFQKLKLHRIALIRDGHVIDKMGSVNIRQLQRETSMESGMYGGATTVELLLDDVRIGDTLWLTYTVTGENPVFDKKWHSEFSWEYDEPIEKHRVTVTYPNNRKLAWDQVGDFKKEAIPNRVEQLPGQTRLQFEQNAIEPIQFESSTPPDFIPVRLLEFSEFSDWHGVAKWADGLFPAVKPGPLQTALYKQFNQEATPEKKAAAALHWVQNEVRYFSVSIGENSHRPQAPDVVIKKRYGDCKDKSYLLVSLLNQMGIKANPVLIAAHAPKIPAKILPSPEWFDHVIVRIEIEGRAYFVDPTITGQVASLELLPTAMPGAAGLLVDSASTALTTLPERADIGPHYEHSETIKISRLDGDATLLMDDIYSGFYSDWARNHFADMSANELKREVLSYYEKQYPGVSIDGAPQLQDDQDKNQYHLRARLNLPTPVKHEEQTYRIGFDSQILKGSLRMPDKLVRNFPFEIAGGKHFSRYRLTIEWPDIVRLNITPSTQNIDNAYFKLCDDTLIRGNQISYLMDFYIKNDIVVPADMETLHTQSRALDHFFDNSFHITEAALASTNSLALSYRSFDAVGKVGQMFQQQRTLKDKFAETNSITDEGCDFLENLVAYQDVFTAESVFQNFLASTRKNIHFSNDTERKCFANLLYDLGWYADSINAAGTTQLVPDADRLTMRLAWARFYANDRTGALNSLEKYSRADRSDNDWTALMDLVAEVALYQRIGQPIPTAIEQAAAADPNGLWPRQLLAMQFGKLTPDQLLAIATAMPADLRDISQAEAWFYIGQHDLAEQNLTAAEPMFRKVLARGIRSAAFYTQARYEWNLLVNRDEQDNAGLAASQRGDYSGAVAIWEKNAVLGSARSQLHLANAYYNGSGVEKNPEKSLYWYQLAAQQGDAIAQFNLATQYIKGEGVARDEKKAIEWFKKSADQEYDGAQNYMGVRYRNGDLVEKNMDEALRLFKLAADQNNSDALGDLCFYYTGQSGVPHNYEAALAWASLGAMRGNAASLVNLGYLYSQGLGVPKDLAHSIALYQLAAAKGNAQAQANLAYDYLMGLGVQVDNETAMTLYRSAAQKDNAMAQYYLGWMFEVGRGVGSDRAEAVKWYQLGASNGNKDAQYRLAQLYQNGLALPKDMAQAVLWYKKAAEQGNSDAANELGVMYEKGDLGVKDPEQALQWYLKAAAAGHILAQNNLGAAYMRAEQLPDHLEQAEKWFRQAAAHGNVNAQNNLAVLLSMGERDEKNYVEAYKWWEVVKKSAKPGTATFNSAAHGLENLNEKLNVDQIAAANKDAEAWLASKK